jgi:hypothetical protein
MNGDHALAIGRQRVGISPAERRQSSELTELDARDGEIPDAGAQEIVTLGGQNVRGNAGAANGIRQRKDALGAAALAKAALTSSVSVATQAASFLFSAASASALLPNSCRTFSPSISLNLPA